MKVALAYSGGLDTSVILAWLIEEKGAEVVTYTADVGQGEEVEEARAKALATGAVAAIVEDLREEFVSDAVFPALRASAVRDVHVLIRRGPQQVKFTPVELRQLGDLLHARGRRC